jgi:hypothetical protein
MRRHRLVTVGSIVAATALITACGAGESATEDGGGEPPEPTALESSLRTTIEDVRDSPETPLETVDCPDDVDSEGGPATFDCELSGGSETGTVEVTLRGERFEYSGAFGGSSFGGSVQDIEAVEP